MYSLQISLLLRLKSLFVSPILQASLGTDQDQHSLTGSAPDNTKCSRSLTFHSSSWLSHPVRTYSLQISSLLHPKSLSISPILQALLGTDQDQRPAMGPTAGNTKRSQPLMFNSSGRLSHPVRMYSLQISSLLYLKSLFVSPTLQVSLGTDQDQHSLMGSAPDNTKRSRSLMFHSSSWLSHPIRMYSLQISSLLRPKSLSVRPSVPPIHVVGYSGSALSRKVNYW